MWIYLKYLLFPFSIIYGFITSLRNFLYDYNILESKKYNVKVISIGNLVMGGSGKTPMVEYISRYFIKKNYKFSIISRGYKRLTKGLRLINESDTYLTVGDEPKQLYNKFGNTSKVIVTEDRHKAIKLIELAVGKYESFNNILESQKKIDEIFPEIDDLELLKYMQVLYLKDGRQVIITSNHGQYNKLTHDCFFEESVKAIEGKTEIFSDNKYI